MDGSRWWQAPEPSYHVTRKTQAGSPIASLAVSTTLMRDPSMDENSRWKVAVK
jgi:hypothetical protein